MLADFNYTTTVRRFATRFPLLSYVGIQIVFWIVSNNLLVLILYCHALFVSDVFNVPAQDKIAPIIIVSTIISIMYGVVLGISDYYLDRHYFRKMVLGKMILVKVFISLATSAFIFGILSFVLIGNYVPYLIPVQGISINRHSWEYIIWLFVIYYLLMTLLIGFINQVNKKYGPGVLVPLVLGKYRNPVEEMRVFMFMDLKSSTTIAEILGHLKYSAFIRDSFYDINQVLSPYNAEIYQYVGDEIVVSWRVNSDIVYERCASFFFACKQQFLKRSDYYREKYGFFPEFKAGLHMGIVTAVEIGDIKRDIAYHGDTINTTARIQSVCNQFDKEFLVSMYLLEKTGINAYFNTQPLGLIQLKGKMNQIGIASIEGKISNTS